MVNSDITSLFSSNNNDEWHDVQHQVEGQLNTSQLYLIGHENSDVAIETAALLSKHIERIEGIKQVIVKLDKIPNQTLMIKSYKGVEQQLLTPSFKQAILNEDSASLFKMQFDVLNQLGNQLVAQTIEKDTTLAFAQFLNRSPLPSSTLTINPDGFLTVNYQGVVYVLMTLETEHSAFNINASTKIVTALNQLTQAKVLSSLAGESQTLSAELLTQLSIVKTGAIFYSVEASTNAQWEMQWLGGLSIVATLLLILLSYRRFVMVLSTIFLIGISMLYGFVGLTLFFDEINIISLVFAITLIGISADYSFHSLTQLKQTSRTEKKPLNAIKVSLTLSFITTSLGYILLVIVPIALFKQIAVFTIVGLLGALLTVILAYPLLHQIFNFNAGGQNNRFYCFIHQQHQRLFKQVNYVGITIAVLMILSVIIIQQKSFTDDARSFYQASNELTLNEQKVKEILGQKFDNQYALIRADTAQALLEREESYINDLNQLVSDGGIGSYQAVANWLPSIAQQKQNNALLINANQQGLFNQLAQVIGQPHLTIKPISHFLTPKQWFLTPFGQTQQHLWLNQDVNNTRFYYSIIRFSGIEQLEKLSAVFDNQPNSIFVDTLADKAIEIGHFRLLLIIVFAMACLSALVIFSYRFGFKKACLGIFIPLSAFIIALAISALIQGTLTLFNLAAGLVILALALDYAVFYGEHGFIQSITQTTFMSAVSSVFVFAMLGFSSTPAIASFGQTVFFGIAIAFICSPIITQIHEIKKGKLSHDLQ